MKQLSFLPGMPGAAATTANPAALIPSLAPQQPMGDPNQLQLQQGMAQLQALTGTINQKHQELLGLIQHHDNFRKSLGV